MGSTHVGKVIGDQNPKGSKREVGRWTQVFMAPLLLDASRSLPEFAELDLQGKVLPEGVGPGDIKAFQVLYREHCEVGLSDE